MSITLLMKLGSIAVHADEFLFSGQGNPVDKDALRTLLDDAEVKDALADLDRQALIPVRRDGVRYK